MLTRQYPADLRGRVGPEARNPRHLGLVNVSDIVVHKDTFLRVDRHGLKFRCDAMFAGVIVFEREAESIKCVGDASVVVFRGGL